MKRKFRFLENGQRNDSEPETREMKKVGDICDLCLRPFTQEVVDLKRKIRADNARASMLKAIANGAKLGRKRTRNDEQILSLRKQGFSMREIAKRSGCSTGAVQASLKGTGLNGKIIINSQGRSCSKQNCWCRSRPSRKQP